MEELNYLHESSIYRSIQAEAEARMQKKIALNCLGDGLLPEVVA